MLPENFGLIALSIVLVRTSEDESEKLSCQCILFFFPEILWRFPGSLVRMQITIFVIVCITTVKLIMMEIK